MLARQQSVRGGKGLETPFECNLRSFELAVSAEGLMGEALDDSERVFHPMVQLSEKDLGLPFRTLPFGDVVADDVSPSGLPSSSCVRPELISQKSHSPRLLLTRTS